MKNILIILSTLFFILPFSVDAQWYTTKPATNTISPDETENSTKTLLLADSTFTGQWSYVNDYSTVQVAIYGTNSAATGTLYFDLSQDGGSTFTSVSASIDDITFDFPHILKIVEPYVRIRYVNNSVAQTGTFHLITRYASDGDLGLLHKMGNTINGTVEGQIVKSVVTGADPNGVYVNQPASGISNFNTTAIPLGADSIFLGKWTRVELYTEARFSSSSNVAGSNLLIQFAVDTNIVERNISIPPVANSLNTNFGGVHTINPILPWMRVKYINGSVAQDTFNLTTILSTTSGGGLVSRSTQVINKYNDVRLQRVINSPDLDRNQGLISYQSAERKFGENNSVAGSYEDVWSQGGTHPYITTPRGIRVQAGGNALDDNDSSGARQIEVTFIDENFNKVIDTLVLAGASASDSTVKAWHLQTSRVIVSGTYATANTGDIDIETVDGILIGDIPANYGRTQQTSYFVPAGKTAYITDMTFSVGAGNSADVRLYVVKNADDITAPFTSVKNIVWLVENFSGVQNIPLTTYIKVPEKSIIRFEAIKVSGGGDAEVAVDYEFDLIDN